MRSGVTLLLGEREREGGRERWRKMGKRYGEENECGRVRVVRESEEFSYKRKTSDSF